MACCGRHGRVLATHASEGAGIHFLARGIGKCGTAKCPGVRWSAWQSRDISGQERRGPRRHDEPLLAAMKLSALSQQPVAMVVPINRNRRAMSQERFHRGIVYEPFGRGALAGGALVKGRGGGAVWGCGHRHGHTGPATKIYALRWRFGGDVAHWREEGSAPWIRGEFEFGGQDHF